MNPTEGAQHFVYYVDQDWNMPIGYVFLTSDSITKMQMPTFNAAFWTRRQGSDFAPHLFHEGKEVGKIFMDDMEMGKPSATDELTDEPNQSIENSNAQKGKWTRVVCSFPDVKAWNKTGKAPNVLTGQKGEIFFLKDHPGEYELKVLCKGKLARSIKFTVDAEGNFDSSISTANKLGSNRAIVPVQIIGDQEGEWDHDAWKSDAFYGNPLTGFSAVP